MIIKGPAKVLTGTICFDVTVDLLLRTDLDGRCAYRGSMHMSAGGEAAVKLYGPQQVYLQVDGVTWDIAVMQASPEGVLIITTVGSPHPL